MKRGKDRCRILKEIRRQIAEANDISLVIDECRYQGECLGTCPRCEAEVDYLERELRRRSMAGHTVRLAGISAGVLIAALGSEMSASASEPLKADSTDAVDTTQVSTKDNDKVFGMIGWDPQFPGGQQALVKWVSDNVRYPVGGINLKEKQRVTVQFVVKADCTIGEIRIAKSTDPRLDPIALDVIQRLPSFAIPAKDEYGVPQDVWYTLPINFLPDSEETGE